MVETSLTMYLSAPLPDARIARLTHDLERDLRREGINAQPVQETTAIGERGEPVTLGVLALALITSGTVKSLIDCLKAYLAREPSLVIKLQHPNGTQVEVNARNVDAHELRSALQAAASA